MYKLQRPVKVALRKTCETAVIVVVGNGDDTIDDRLRVVDGGC